MTVRSVLETPVRIFLWHENAGRPKFPRSAIDFDEQNHSDITFENALLRRLSISVEHRLIERSKKGEVAGTHYLECRNGIKRREGI